MKNALNKTYKGFTIIEVMIVLAIAGLIMVIVFFAIPQLQRNQRDNARQSLTSRIKAEVETYASNNQGVYPYSAPAAWSDFFTRYIGTPNLNINDPSTGNPVIGTASGNPTTFTIAGCANATCSNITLPANRGDFVVAYAAKCNGEVLAVSGTLPPSLNTKNYATVIGLDRTGTRFCVDNG